MRKPYELNLLGEDVYISFTRKSMVVDPRYGRQKVTICTIRIVSTFETFAGVTLCNPNDEENKYIGMRTALCLAVERLLNNRILNNDLPFRQRYTESQHKEIRIKIRRWFYRAYHKEYRPVSDCVPKKIEL